MRALRNFRRFGLLFLFSLLISGFVSHSPPASGNRSVAVIFLKHTPPFCATALKCLPYYPQEVQDLVLAPRHSAASYTNMLNSSVRDYFQKNSFNQVHLSFTAIPNPGTSDGWFEAPHKLHEYNQVHLFSIHQDGLDLAHAAIGAALGNYDKILVVHNIHTVTGYAPMGCDIEPGGEIICAASAGGNIFNLGIAVAGESIDDEHFMMAASHELGHLYSLGHTEMGPYDLMGNCDEFTHFGGWSKMNAGWLTGVTDMPCSQGPCEITTTLDPLEYPGNNLLRIPFTQNPFVGYTAECRAKVNHDENIPEAGVIITSVDTIANPELLATIVFPSGDQDYSNAALAPGEAFIDEAREITITYLSKDTYNNCTVKAERGEINAPDPFIKRGAEEMTGMNTNLFQSRDIWVDSQENGWDIYPFGSSFSVEGGVNFPTQYGDPFWPGHENRIHFFVRNGGFGPAENVSVDVYVDQPILITIPGMDCWGPKIKGAKLAGSVVIDSLEKDEIYHGYVNWTPETNSTAQITVVINDYVGEITHSNNTASETQKQQFTIAGSLGTESANLEIGPMEMIHVEAVKNCLIPSSFVLQQISVNAIERRDWVMQFDPAQGMVAPGEENEVRLMSIPPEGAQPGDCAESAIEVRALFDDIHIPINGLVLRNCVVEPSKLTCAAPDEELELEANVIIKGVLTPARNNSRVALVFTSPRGESYIQNAMIGKTGEFQAEFLPEISGDWKVGVFWQGDDFSAPAESEPCFFKVKSREPEFTLNHNINCRLGPSTDYPVATSGLIGDVMPIEARSEDSLWLFGTLNYNKCWVSLELGELNVKPWTLPVRITPELKKAPAHNCQQYPTEAACNRFKTYCKWVPPSSAVQGTGKCVNK